MKAVRSLLILLFLTLPFCVDAQTKKSVALSKQASDNVVAGEYKTALQLYSLAIKDSPEFADYYYLRGYTYDMLGQFELGIADFDRSIKLNPKNAVAYNNRGYAYYSIQRYEQAMTDYNQAIKINPNLATAYSNRALLLVLWREYQYAIYDLNQSLELGMVNNSSIYNLRGYSYMSLGNQKLALIDFNKAITLEPSYADAYFNRGIAKYKVGDKTAYNDFVAAKKLSHPEADEWLEKFKPKKI